MRYKTRFCQRCGNEYQPTTGNQKYCVACKQGARAERNHGYYIENADIVAVRTKGRRASFRANHPQEYNQRNAAQARRYRALNPDKIREINAEYYAMHRNEIMAQISVYRSTHRDQRRLIDNKHAAKHRALGFIPLNEWFGGCEAHHLDHDRVVYIPRELHRSIHHDQRTGQNMNQINALALQWLEQTRPRTQSPICAGRKLPRHSCGVQR